jgi:predicted acetyltransferase
MSDSTEAAPSAAPSAATSAPASPGSPQVEVQHVGADRRADVDELLQWVWAGTDDPVDEDYLGFEWERTAVATVDGRDAGLYSAYSLQMSVPGGQLPASGLTYVGVHPQHRRRGVLRRMIDHHLAEIAERGTEPVSVLWAAEPAIYGRFGYGLATHGLRFTLPRGAAMRPVPGTERLRVRMENADVDRHAALVDECYEAFRAEHPGAVSRGLPERARQLLADPKEWRGGSERKKVLVVEDEQGRVRATALFRRKEGWEDTGPTGTVRVIQAAALDAAATHVLWSTLADLDLMSTVETDVRPVDDPLLHLLVDLRQAKVRLSDALWLRVVDLPAAMTARAYAGPLDVVLEVADDLLPANAGRWHLRCGADGTGAACERTDAEPALRMDVRDLGALYLGGQNLSQLVAAGQVEVLDDAAVVPAARALGWHVAAFNGAMF